jgi:hypothetical protein
LDTKITFNSDYYYLHGINCYNEANKTENHRDRTQPALHYPIPVDPSFREENYLKHGPSNYKHKNP